MKKLFCLILCLVLSVSFCACGKGEDKDNESEIDLSYYALLGQIPEVEYSLGADPDVIIEKLNAKLKEENANHKEDPNHEHEHSESEFYFEVTEGENSVLLDNGHIRYYYNKANKEDGISYIVNYDTAYGLPLGTLVSEVKETFPNIEFMEEPVAEHNAFFATNIMNGVVLTTAFDSVAISFVFQDNALFATFIRNSNWKY